MTDQEWQAGIERALNAAWGLAADDAGRLALKVLIVELVHAAPVRITLVHTNKDKLGHFRVGPAQDEAA